MDCDPHATNPAFDPLGFRRWRRQVQHDNAGKVIVCVGEVFGILPLIEFSALISATVPIRGAPTRADLLVHYGVVSEPGA